MRTTTLLHMLAGTLACCALAFATPLQAQPAGPTPLDHLPALTGGYFPVDSDARQRYHIHVRLPLGHADAPDRRWPVVYVLDGDSLFPLLAPTHLFLHYDDGIPEAIIVGIAYGSFDPSINRRDVDFSAAGPDTPAGEAGADAFLRTLQTRILPEVEQRFRGDADQRILVGQSRAGYFVLWSALQAPDLFWARIASNPAFTRSREALFTAPFTAARTDTSVVVVSGARDLPLRVRNAHDWTAFWQPRPDRPWSLHLVDLPDGTHAASIGDGYRQALRWLFRDTPGAAGDD